MSAPRDLKTAPAPRRPRTGAGCVLLLITLAGCTDEPEAPTRHWVSMEEGLRLLERVRTPGRYRQIGKECLLEEMTRDLTPKAVKALRLGFDSEYADPDRKVMKTLFGFYTEPERRRALRIDLSEGKPSRYVRWDGTGMKVLESTFQDGVMISQTGWRSTGPGPTDVCEEFRIEFDGGKPAVVLRHAHEDCRKSEEIILDNGVVSKLTTWDAEGNVMFERDFPLQ